jgi:hypothetical protein
VVSFLIIADLESCSQDISPDGELHLRVESAE